MPKKIYFILIVFTLVIYPRAFVFASVVIQTNPFTSADAYGLSPFWKWETIESENFKITFPAELKSVAIRSSQIFEEAHELLSPLLKWKPSYRPQIIIVDNNDSANGTTTPIIRFGIVLFVTPPESWSSLNFYDDWLRLLIIHEYTHFLNMDTTEGLYKPLRYVFGDTLLPNSIWPPWMLEGLAVYMETKYTGAGRGRSSYYEMFLRTAVDEKIFGSKNFITLEQLGGTNPYFPFGDTRYIFGYQLINEVGTEYGSKSLGELSSYSGKNIPFFINSNLQKITGKTWYEFWDQWILKTRMRVEGEINIIKSQPLAKYQLMTNNSRELSNSILGAAVSADQNWIAYTMSSSEQREGIYLKNLRSGEIQRLNDKNMGVGMKFYPNSQFLFCSELRQLDQYHIYSDLEYYSLKDHSRHWLTHQLRAKDPDVSHDGNWIVFTLVEMGKQAIAIAPLIYDEVHDQFRLGKVQKIFDPPPFGRASNPKFSLDNKKIYFSFHPDGKAQEDIMEYDRGSKRTSLVYSDGFFNRFPVVSGSGNLYFVSNATGVDNLFEFRFSDKRTHLVSNFVTGVSLPAFDLDPDSSFYYASLFSTQGWNLAKIELLNAPIEAKAVQIPHWPVPSAVSQEIKSNSQSAAPSRLKITDYSAIPSLLPRAWMPLVGVDQTGVSLGAQLLGFDAINQHRYFLGTAFQTNTKLWDAFALYSNRTLGIDWSTWIGVQTLSYDFSDSTLSYTRSYTFNSLLSYPFLQIYSDFIPSLGFSFQKVGRQNISNYPATENLPSIHAELVYSNTAFSNLSVAPEGGRYSQISSKYYLKGQNSGGKILWKDKEYFRIQGHSVISASLQGSWASRLNINIPSAAAILQGRNSQQVLNSFVESSTPTRGYPGFIHYSQFNLVGALDYIFPIARIFKGWGTNPVFINNLVGVLFLESSYASPTPFSQSGISTGVFLPSAGGGLRLFTELFYFPVTLSYEYHKGFRKAFGRSDDLFFQLSVQGFQF